MSPLKLSIDSTTLYEANRAREVGLLQFYHIQITKNHSTKLPSPDECIRVWFNEAHGDVSESHTATPRLRSGSELIGSTKAKATATAIRAPKAG